MLHLQCNGLLHSDICGSILACNSPQLFAAYRVLRRLPMPRHPPCALISLTVSILRIELRVASQLILIFWIFLILESNGSELCLSHYEKFYFVVFLPRCFTCVRYYTFFLIALLLLYSVFKMLLTTFRLPWWAQVDSNHRPHAYQACALTTWAMRPFSRIAHGSLVHSLFPLGGDEEDRTPDPLLAKQVLSQLSYTPI